MSNNPRLNIRDTMNCFIIVLDLIYELLYDQKKIINERHNVKKHTIIMKKGVNTT